jgi:hypothetical protein
LKIDENTGLEQGEKFYRPKKEKFNLNKENFFVLEIVDVTSSIRLAKISNEKKLLMIINAIVSHEMRNPIHSI